MHRGDAEIKMPGLSFHLLLELARATPNVLSYDELIDRVWSGRIVSQETVTQRVKLLRQALADDAHAPRYIGLVRGEGYRMLPKVTLLAAGGIGTVADSPAPSRLPKIAFGLMLLAVVALVWEVGRESLRSPAKEPGTVERAPHSVVVLPFANASESPDDLYLSDGLGDDLRDLLGRQLGLRVAARTSSEAIGDQALDATEISARLGVATLIEGALRREADQLRISIQIIDGVTGFQTWSQTYNLRMQDLLSVQRQIASEVIQELLPKADLTAVNLHPVTRSVSAHELMLLASHYEKQVHDEPIVDQALLLKAIELYRQATEADPGLALAHSRLAGALIYLGDINSAEQPIFEALTLDPNLADAQYTLGLYHWSRREPGAGAAFERAIALNDNFVEALSAYGMWLSLQFDYVEAVEYFRRALLLDPLSHARYLELGNHLGIGGWVDEAKALAREIEFRFEPNDGRAYQIIARIHEVAGELGVALGWALRSKRAMPDEPEADWMIAELLARLGMFEQAKMFEPEPGIGQLYWKRDWAKLIELGNTLILEHPNEIEIWYSLAWAYNATGQFQQSIRLLETAGLPKNALGESRRSIDVEAMITLADAYDAAGHREEAENLAGWYVNSITKTSEAVGEDAWWWHIYLACAHAILRQDTRAMGSLEKLARAKGLVWYPLVADAHCFQRFSEDGRYSEVVEALDSRKTKMRASLPGTLAEMNVSLDVSLASK